MALPSSGQITHAMIQAEFGGSNPIGLNEYYGVAAGIPTSGTISNGDFYGASAAPNYIDLTGGTYTYNSSYIYGYGRAYTYAFRHPEAGATYSVNFGSVSQYVGVAGGYDLLSLSAQTLPDGKWIVLTISNPYGTNPNWTRMGIRTKGGTDTAYLERSSYIYYGANQFGKGIIVFRGDSGVNGTVWNHISNSRSTTKEFWFE